jgi:hypothetical protein
MRRTQFLQLINKLIGRGTFAIFILVLYAALMAPVNLFVPQPVRAATTQEKEETPHFCTELVPPSLDAAGRTALFWKGKSKLRVRFIDGSETLREHVRHYASIWNEYSGLPFVFVENEPSDIRVSFTPSGRSWSYIGNSAEYINNSKATMNFGWFDEHSTTEVEFRRAILHEFGHALGLIHEHQSPEALIHWNKPKVYKYYEENYGWNENVVDDNIFKKYSETQTQYTAYDPTSIMQYPIPTEFTTDGTSVGWNTSLSSTDIAFISKKYPKH